MKRMFETMIGAAFASPIIISTTWIALQVKKMDDSTIDAMSYINNNFDEFKNQIENSENEFIREAQVAGKTNSSNVNLPYYKNESSTSNFDANEISKSIKIRNMDGGEDNLLLFDNMVGYMLVTDDNELLDMNIDIKMNGIDLKTLYSSSTEGLMIGIEGGVVVFSEYANHKDLDLFDELSGSNFTLLYSEKKDGEIIENPDDYVNSTYKEWKFKGDESYIAYSDDIVSSQTGKTEDTNNTCVINGVYTVFRQKLLSGYGDFNQDYIDEEAKKATNINNRTKLYASVEDSSIDSGWSESATNFTKINNILTREAEKHDIDEKGWSRYSWFASWNKLEDEIDDNNPILLSLSSGQYSNHVITATGYREYEKNNGWWVFSYKTYRRMIKVNDSHSTEKVSRWFDWHERSFIRGMHGL